MVSKGQIVGIDWNHIARLHSHVLAHMNSLTASRCHINASHMNSLTASRRHIKAYQDGSAECISIKCSYLPPLRGSKSEPEQQKK